MKALLAAALSGVLFGLGLLVSGMSRPEKVVGFLDVTGEWDPSLAFVMMGAIAVHLVAYRLLPRLPAPLGGGAFALPTRKDIDGRLLAGGAIFGIGWGMAGYCPGPAVLSITTGTVDALVMCGSMVAGMLAFGLFDRTLGRDDG